MQCSAPRLLPRAVVIPSVSRAPLPLTAALLPFPFRYEEQLHRRQRSTAQLLEGGHEQLGRLSATARAHLRAVLCECLASLDGPPPPPQHVATCRSLFADGTEAPNQMGGALTEVSSPLKPPPAKRRSSAMAVRPSPLPSGVNPPTSAGITAGMLQQHARIVTYTKHARHVPTSSFTYGIEPGESEEQSERQVVWSALRDEGSRML